MPPTTRRSSSRLAAAASSSPSSSKTDVADIPSAGSARKRKADTSTSPSEKNKKQKEQQAEKQQQTLEETLDNGDSKADEKQKEIGDEGVTDTNMKEAEADATTAPSADQKRDADDKTGEATKADADGEKQNGDNGSAEKDESRVAADNGEKPAEAPKTTVDPADGAIEQSSQRKNEMPSNILEKGIIYFFTRARVGLDQPTSVQEIARSYLVLRPLPHSAKLGDGPIEDLKNSRLLALPKKVLPKSGQDRFMTFVEKAGASIEQLKEEFMTGSTYDTQTSGVRSSPPVTPLAEGVYAITTTGRESHLAYMLTIPSELGEVQKAVGLADKGSFILSTKNPETKGPSIAQFDNPAEFSKDIMEQFAGRRWMPTEPKHLDFAAAQLLLIGEAQGDLGKATQADERDAENDDKKAPEEEMELLQDEDLNRVQALKGDDTIFDDLGISKKEYPQVQTTW